MITITPTFYTGTRQIRFLENAVNARQIEIDRLRETYLVQGNSFSEQQQNTWAMVNEDLVDLTNQINAMDNSERDRIMVEINDCYISGPLLLREDLARFQVRSVQIAHAILCDVLTPLIAEINAKRFFAEVYMHLPNAGWTVWAWQVQDWFLSRGIKTLPGKECGGK